MRPPQKKCYSNDFQTPPSAIRPLIPYLNRSWVIWECACGKGNLVRELEKSGFKVIGSDIIFGQDFLSWQPNHFDCIITNPPYSLRYEFIKRCYELGKPWAMLMPFTTLEGRRQELFKKYGIELLVLNKRVPFETPSGRGSGPWFPVAWFCWKILPRQIMFEDHSIFYLLMENEQKERIARQACQEEAASSIMRPQPNTWKNKAEQAAVA